MLKNEPYGRKGRAATSKNSSRDTIWAEQAAPGHEKIHVVTQGCATKQNVVYHGTRKCMPGHKSAMFTIYEF